MPPRSPAPSRRPSTEHDAPTNCRSFKLEIESLRDELRTVRGHLDTLQRHMSAINDHVADIRERLATQPPDGDLSAYRAGRQEAEERDRRRSERTDKILAEVWSKGGSWFMAALFFLLAAGAAKLLGVQLPLTGHQGVLP